jgi:uncharacterized protein
MHPQTLIVAAGAAFGGFAQGLCGSAFGLIALSIWVWVVDPTLLAPLIVFGSLGGQVATAGILRHAWKPSLFWPFVVGGVLGVPVGVALLRWVDPLAFKIGVGVLLVLWCPTMLLLRDLPEIRWGGRVADRAALDLEAGDRKDRSAARHRDRDGDRARCRRRDPGGHHLAAQVLPR